MIGRRATAAAVLGLAGTGIASFAGADTVDRRRIKADPAYELLFEAPEHEELEAVSADGTRLHVEASGPEDAPPVVLVHGWTCAVRFWRRQIRDLMADHRVIAFDLRGHGRSGTPEGGDWSPDALGDDLQAVLEQCVGDRPALLAGHSLGGMTIAAWAGRHAGEVQRRASGAVLINTGMGDLISESLVVRTPDAFGRVNQAVGTFLLGSATPLPPRPDPVSHRIVRYVALSPSASPAAVRMTEDLVLNSHPRVRAGCGRELSRLDLLERVAHLTVPTVVIAGKADKLTPPVHAERLAGALPDLVDMLELEGCGHMGPLERADEVTAALLRMAGAEPAPVGAEAVRS